MITAILVIAGLIGGQMRVVRIVAYDGQTCETMAPTMAAIRDTDHRVAVWCREQREGI